jgi:hypothetical protein
MRKVPRRIPVPPKSKKPGLAYAYDGEGLELPVIDLSHPAFALDPSEGEILSRVDAAIAEMRAFSSPSLRSRAKRALFSLLSRRSVLVRSIGSSSGGYLGGLATYRVKLGPGNLGPGWAGAIDRSVADSLPCYSARLRLRDSASLLAEVAREALSAARPGAALALVNVAGGAAMDSLNALILLRSRDPAALEGRRLDIYVLDRDEAGPAFAARALGALMAEGLPLHGLDARLTYLPYDWSDAGALRDLAEELGRERAACALSSEGGLFEYAGDEAIAANLRAAAEGLSSGCGSRSLPPWVGTISRVEGPAAFLNGASGAALRLRPRPELEAAVAAAGYRLTRTLDCPLSTVFSLGSAPRA